MWSSHRRGVRRTSLLFAVCAGEDHKREGTALPGEKPEGDYRKHLLMTTLSSQERDANAEVGEVPDEMKPSPFRQVPNRP